MGGPLQIRPDRTFAPLLATACVLVGGAAVCIAIVASSGTVQPVPIAIVVGVALGMLFLLWCLRDKPVAHKRSWFAWVMHGRNHKQRLTYEFRAVHPRVEFGSNKPPTLEDLRDSRDATRTWVPSASRTSTRRQGAIDS